MSIPALIVSYSRHQNVLVIIKQLRNQGVRKIYLAIDGPKNLDHDLQNRIEKDSRELAEELGVNLRIWHRDSNLGPAVSVITAIDWFFKNEESGVILEDDLILSDGAIGYFDFALSRYADVNSVFLIAGSNYFGDGLLGSKSSFATHYPVTWGWATWRSRWTEYRSVLTSLSNFQAPGGLIEKWFWKNGLRRCLNGIQDAWDIPLATFQLSQKILSVIPPVNLISNIGADSFAGNTLVDEWPLNRPLERLPIETLLATKSHEKVFEPSFTSKIDSLFYSNVYKIQRFRTLPPGISMILDLLRHPVATRRKNLIERLELVALP